MVPTGMALRQARDLSQDKGGIVGTPKTAILDGFVKAHGTEMPSTAEPFLYAFGFLTGTALIHVAGVVMGDIAKHNERGKLILRGGGGLISLIGVLFIAGVL